MPALKRQSVRTPLATEEWSEFLEFLDAYEMDPYKKAVLQIIATRGLRCSDTLRIKKAEVKKALKSGVLSFLGKGERRINYPAASIREPLEVLAGMPGDGDTPVYRAITAGKIQTAARAVREELAAICRRFGRGKGEIYAHRFRHTFVNHFLDELEGDPAALFKLQDAMDWASQSTARNYVRHAELGETAAVEERIAAKRKRRS